MIWQQLPQFIVSGITSGSIYALIALGFCIIHNATGIVNFAQGEFVMLGGLTIISLNQTFHVPLVVAFPLTILFVMGIGALLEFGPIRHSKSKDILILVMITIGASIFIRGFSPMIWGKMARTLPPFSGDTPILVLNAAIMPQTLWILGISFVVLLCLHLFFLKTPTGRAMRAVADNRMGAALTGINVDKIVLLSFVFAAALGATAGVIITPITATSYDSGVMLGLKGFSGAVLGGYGNFAGAILGGLLLGVLESLEAGFISSEYKHAIAFLILLLVLFWKPSGLLGKGEIRKV
ncbi:MAG: branched-chain amino acid ABC transporter permease [Deltaproteobacteria bacterium]|nr:MAG: branched-chain amino acid ABC transporter permease [Deltaproteobacteria bacterium]